MTKPFDRFVGDITGIDIPAHPEALLAGGADLLTQCFRAFGSLSRDNAVSAIRRVEDCPGGSTGKKLFLSIEYAQPDPFLHTELFAKFSRDFTDQTRDARGKHEMAGEVTLAALSRQADFPVKVCSAYFADHEAASTTGLIITERVAFGTNEIEPHHPKCMDYLIEDPLDHYRVIISSLARLAAADHSGRLGIVLDAGFPYDAAEAVAANALLYDAESLRDRVRSFAAFAASHSQLFPAEIATSALFTMIEQQVAGFAEHEATIRRFLQGDPRLIALCHWNANIDNAWFWRDQAGQLRCGLMDWGRTGRMNVAFSLWGCLSGAGLDIWNHHLDELLRLFTDELHAHGGPQIAIEELRLHLELYAALMGLSYFLDSPARIAQGQPEYAKATGPLDPLIQAHETVRNQLSISTTFLNLWRRHDLGQSLIRMLARSSIDLPA